MVPASSQYADLEHFLALGAKLFQKALPGLGRQTGPEASEKAHVRLFSGLGHHMVPEDSQKAHLEHVLALGAKRPQKALRRRILDHFLALGAKRPQKALRRLIWSVSWPGAPNDHRRVSEGSFGAFLDLGRQLVPEGFRTAHLEYFCASAAKRPL